MFKLISIELDGFLGFAKPRIKNFKANFEHNKLQVFNSGNGDGKSTTISELNPFPIQKELFEADGYKKLVFEAPDGKVYMTESNHKKNFLWDMESGENLNDGGTQTQLVALINQLFNITPFIWNICMGASSFTKADKNSRRRWIEAISGVDFDYGFDIYRTIVGEINATKGASKHLTAQLATEASKLLSAEEIAELEHTRNLLSVWIKEALIERDSSISIDDKIRLEKEIKDLEDLTKGIQKAYNDLATFINPFGNLTTLESLREHHSSIKQRIETINLLVDGKIKELEERSSLLVKLDSTKGIDIDKAREDLKHNTELKERLNTELYELPNVEAWKSVIIEYTNKDTLSGLLDVATLFSTKFITHLVSSKDLQDSDLYNLMDSAEYLVESNKLTDLNNSYQRLVKSNELLQANLLELEKTESVDCPTCGTDFRPNEELIKSTYKQLDTNTESMLSIDGLIKELEPRIEHERKVNNNRTYIHDTLKIKFKDYPTYFLVLQGELERLTTVGELSQLLHTGQSVIESTLGLVEVIGTIAELTSIIREYDLVNGVIDGKELGSIVSKLEEEITNLRTERKQLEDELNLVVETGKVYNKHNELLNRLKCGLEELITKRAQYGKVLENVTLESIERDLQVRLADVSKKVIDNEILVNLISKLEEMLAEAKEKIEDLKVIEQAFSPSTGLIAEQLVGYVQAFSSQITSIIAKLWGYPLTIKPCGLEGKKGMDYLFPFNVGGKDIPDISKGSKSQLSVINLAVMLCTRISLKLNHLPLFLDEVGSGFDTVHNEKLGEFIRELLMNYECSNVFLVHHDASIRNSLGSRDTIVFDPSQVIVEPGYNAHVEIEHY